MLDRKQLLALAVGGILTAMPTTRLRAQTTASIVDGVSHLMSFSVADEKNEKEDDEKGGEHEEHEEHDEHDEHGEKHEEKEIEQAVPMNMVPEAVLDAVKKEVPGGTITEAELEAKHGKIMYSFDVKSADMAYDVKITVDGKFYSKKVDDEKDEKDEKSEKPKKSQAGDKD
jgi:uncharacterized membrane protein YkoI